jgi:hypothetical protein
MKLDIKKLSDELGLSYDIDETQTIRCAYCGYYVLRYDQIHNKDIYYKTKITNEEQVFSFLNVERVYDDDYNYNCLKHKLIKTINKFKLEKIEKRKEELCKDF